MNDHTRKERKPRQRVSNPVYRARFTRNEGRIGLAESAE